MEDLIKKIESELDKLSIDERNKILTKLRRQVDKIDREVVELISERTLRSVLIGRIKRSLGEPTYNPERENGDGLVVDDAIVVDGSGGR